MFMEGTFLVFGENVLIDWTWEFVPSPSCLKLESIFGPTGPNFWLYQIMLSVSRARIMNFIRHC